MHFAAEGKVKGSGCWEGRAGFGSSCVNMCCEIWLGQLLAELIKCSSSARPGTLQCLCTGDVLSRALLQPQGPPACFKQSPSCRIHWANSTFPSLPIFPVLSDDCPWFSMGQLCLCALTPLYFITFAGRSWLCDTAPGRHSVFGACTHLLTEQIPSHPISPCRRCFWKHLFLSGVWNSHQ